MAILKPRWLVGAQEGLFAKMVVYSQGGLFDARCGLFYAKVAWFTTMVAQLSLG